MKKILTSIKNICIAAVIMLTMCSLAEAHGPERIKFDTARYAKFMRPMKSMSKGRTYCSSSSVKYKGQVFTVTNTHCCAVNGTVTGERRVGNSIETILHASRTADVCILTSSQKNTPIRLAKRDFKKFQKLVVIGYPYGMYQSYVEGVFLHPEDVCYRKSRVSGLPRCISSNIITAEIYPGNSGSPVLNAKGEIVNVAYCGSNVLPNHPCTVKYKDLKQALEVAVLEILNDK